MQPKWLVVCGVLLAQAASMEARAVETNPEPGQPIFTAADIANVYAQATGGHGAAGSGGRGGGHSSRLDETPKALLPDQPRNPPIVEWNDAFLGTGNIQKGFVSPTGAVWQPAFWVFGDFRTLGGYANDGVAPGRGFASARVDIFGHLQLTPTERVLIGFTPLSAREKRATGIAFDDGSGARFVNGLNPNVQTLFFEGDIRQLFPGIDRDDRKGLDFGFSIGKQPIFFQEGIMVNDNIQALGITKDSIQVPSIQTQDIRVTGVFGWADIRRGDNQRDPTAYLFAVFSETQFRPNIVTFDVAYVPSGNPSDLAGVRRGGDGAYIGASTTQRIFGDINTAFRVNGSAALESKGTAVDNGVLFLTEISRNAPASTNIMYANFFQTIGHYTSAARGADQGGPLERVGILFAAPIAGLVGSPVDSYAHHSYGGALGYQMFFDNTRKQLTLELAAKDDTNGSKQGIVAFGGQYIAAIDSRTSISFNAFVSGGENRQLGTGATVGSRTRW